MNETTNDDRNCGMFATVDFGRGPVEVRCTETGEHTEHRSEVFIVPDDAETVATAWSVRTAERGPGDWTGQRIRLKHKRTGVVVVGTISADPPGGETRFVTDFGDDVGAFDWYWSLDG